MNPEPQHEEYGFTFVEIVVSLTILIAIGSATTIKIKNLNRHVRIVETILTADALEAHLAGLLSNRTLIEYNVKRHGPNGLKDCFDTKRRCPTTTANMPFFVPGQKKAFTGDKIFYDPSGKKCQGTCKGYQIITTLKAGCARGNSCRYPTYATIRYQVVSTETKKIWRRGYIDMDQNAEKKFPDLTLQCPRATGVLRGIGIFGQPICDPVSQVKFVDKAQIPHTGVIKVNPIDCSALNKKKSDQYFVKGISASGKIECGERYW